MRTSQQHAQDAHHDGVTQRIRNPDDTIRRAVPFAERVTCTIEEARQATGLGRTKLYELIGDGSLCTTTIGRRRLVLVSSLLQLMQPNAV
jgi:hypothetical protein